MHKGIISKSCIFEQKVQHLPKNYEISDFPISWAFVTLLLFYKKGKII